MSTHHICVYYSWFYFAPVVESARYSSHRWTEKKMSCGYTVGSGFSRRLTKWWLCKQMGVTGDHLDQVNWPSWSQRQISYILSQMRRKWDCMGRGRKLVVGWEIKRVIEEYGQRIWHVYRNMPHWSFLLLKFKKWESMWKGKDFD